jgi:hypothetical protein
MSTTVTVQLATGNWQLVTGDLFLAIHEKLSLFTFHFLLFLGNGNGDGNNS